MALLPFSWRVVQGRGVCPPSAMRQGLAVELARIMGQLGLKRRAVDGGDASRALLEVKRLREAAAETAPDAAGGDPSPAGDAGGGAGAAPPTPPRPRASVRPPPPPRA